MDNSGVEDIGYTSYEDLQCKELNRGVTLKLSENPVAPGATENSSLFVISNTYGYFVAGSSDGFIFDKLSTLRSAFDNGTEGDETEFKAKIKVSIPGNALRIIRLSADELTIVVALTGGKVQLYKVETLLASPNNPAPDSTFSIDGEIRDLRPNPAIERNSLAAILLETGVIQLKNLEGSTTVILDKKKYTAIGWSSKGKQIMCGTNTGVVQQIDPEGVIKKEHAANPSNVGHSVIAISWLETAVFIVVYCPPPDDDGRPSTEFNVCIISKEIPGQPKYYNYGDLCFPMMDDAGSLYYVTTPIKSWGKNIKELIMVTSSPSTDVGIIGRGTDGKWERWDLDDTARPLLPGIDTICVGNGIDLTSTEKLKPLEEDGPEVEPVPIFYIYNNLGVLAAFHVLNVQTAKDGVSCPVMVTPRPLPQSATKPNTLASAAPTLPSVSQAPSFSTASKSSSQKSASSITPSMAPKPSVSVIPAASFAPTVKSVSSASKGFGSSTPINTPASIAPNPVINPNPSFQQAKPLPKQQPPGVVQRLLQEQEAPVKVSHKTNITEEPSAPAPKVSAAMDALSRQLENIYLAMTAELQTLHRHVRETEEVVNAREFVFRELDQFMQLTTKRIKTAGDTKALAESVYNDFVQLRADIIKVSTKRDEIGRLLKARQDPSLRDMVQSSELSPAQLNQQARMKSSFENVDNRLRELEDYVETLSAKTTRIRHGYDIEGPTLDTIRRSIWNISHTLLQRQDDLNKLSSALDNLAISESLNPTVHHTKEGTSKDKSLASSRRNFRASESISIVTEQRVTTHAKDEIARQLRRVFTQDRRSKPILSNLTQASLGDSLSILPNTQPEQFVPVSEPRRAESKKRLSATISSQNEPALPSITSTISSAPVPNKTETPTMLFAKPGTGFNPSPLGANPPSLFGSTNSSTLPAPSFNSPKPFTGFGSAPSFVSTPGTAPLGFSTPPISSFQIPKMDASSISSAPLAAPAWNIPKSFTEPPKPFGEAPKPFTSFQVPTSAANFASKLTQTTPQTTPIPSFSFAKPTSDLTEGKSAVDTNTKNLGGQHDQEEAENEYDEEYDEEGDEDQYDEGYDQEEEEEEGEEGENGRGYQTRYVHDGQEYEIDEGSEPETWGSETDQRDYDNEEEYEDDDQDGENNEGDDVGEESEGEGAITTQPSKAESKVSTKETSVKNAWASPGFQFPITGSGGQGSATAATTDSDSGFSFFTAKTPKDAGEASKPTPAFGAVSGSTNSFGSQTTFAFGRESGSGSGFTTTPVPKNNNPKDDKPSSSPQVKPAPSSGLSTGVKSPAQSESGDDSNLLKDKEQHHGDTNDELDNDHVSGTDDEGQDDEQDNGQDDGQDDVESSGAEEERDDEDEDSDKESALTAVKISNKIAPPAFSEIARSSVSSIGSFNIVDKARDLEESDLDLSKVGFGSSKGTESSSSKLGFGSGPAFGSTTSTTTKSKGFDMPFVKLPRARKGSRDSLDSNTEDDEDNNNNSSDDEDQTLNNKGAANFGQSTEKKANESSLDSFSLSLGGSQSKPTDTKPVSSPWGAGLSSSWGNVSQTSSSSNTTTSGITGSTLPQLSSPPTLSSFASQASSTLTPAPTAWGSGGGFGQTSQLGSGVTSTPFGQAAQTGTSASGFGQSSGFGQTSSATLGFGQTSQIGSGTTFGQTSTFGGGAGFSQTPTSGATTGFGQTSTLGGGSSFGQTSTLGSSTGFGQTSTLGGSSGFGQTSALGGASGFGQTSTLGSATTFGQTSALGGSVGFGQTSTLGGGSGFGQTSALGSGSGFGQTAFGQTAFGQPSQISGFTSLPPKGFSTESNFGSFAKSGTNAFASLANSGTNVLDQQASQGGGFGNAGNTSSFGSGGGFGGSNSTSSFGTGGGFGSSQFGGGNSSGTGFGGFGGGNSAFGSGGGFGSNQGGFGQQQQQQQQQQQGFGSAANPNTNKASFQNFR